MRLIYVSFFFLSARFAHILVLMTLVSSARFTFSSSIYLFEICIGEKLPFWRFCCPRAFCSSPSLFGGVPFAVPLSSLSHQLRSVPLSVGWFRRVRWGRLWLFTALTFRGVCEPKILFSAFWFRRDYFHRCQKRELRFQGRWCSKNLWRYPTPSNLQTERILYYYCFPPLSDVSNKAQFAFLDEYLWKIKPWIRSLFQRGHCQIYRFLCFFVVIIEMWPPSTFAYPKLLVGQRQYTYTLCGSRSRRLSPQRIAALPGYRLRESTTLRPPSKCPKP